MKQREEVVEQIRDILRDYGYDGASLSIISKVTGLTRSSLYHYFPNGKEQMAREALQMVDGIFSQVLSDILASQVGPVEKAKSLADILLAYYREGALGCIVAGLSLSRQVHFQEEMANLLRVWQESMAKIAIEGGMAADLASKASENIICMVEGSLIVSRATGNKESFTRVLDQIPAILVPA